MRRLIDSRSECEPPSAVLLLALAVGLATSAGTAHSAIAVRDLWAPDGEVRAIAQVSDVLYLGGNFSHVGPVSGPAVALDLATAAAQSPYPKVAPQPDGGGRIYAVEPDGSGGWYVGGLFSTVQGQRRQNLAHIDAAGQVTSWNPHVGGQVSDIAVGNGVVYVVGAIASVGAVQRFGAAAIDATTGIATTWNPDPNGVPSEVEVGGGKVYVAGYFTSIYYSTSPQPRLCLAEFTEVVPGDPGSGALTELFAGSDPSLAVITELELSGGKLFFAPVYSSGRYVRIYDVAAGVFFPYSVVTNGPVHAVAVDEAHGTIFIGGAFGNVQGVPRTCLAALDLATGAVSPWSVDADERVLTLAMAPNGLLVGGEFSTLGGTPRRGVGIVDPGSGSVLGWDAGCRGNVLAVAVDGARAYVGGEFSIINSVPRGNLAAIDETSGAALAWNPSTNATVEALMVSGSTVYAGGQFSSVNGTPRNRAAAVDAVTGALTAFNPNVDVLGPTTVKTFAISGSTVYMGGAFGAVGGVERVGIAAVNASTGALLNWDPLSNGAVHSITYVAGGVFTGPFLVVGGDFTVIGGQFRNYLAMLDPGTAASGALDSPNAPVHSVFVEPLPPGYGGYNQIFIAGAFTTVAGQTRLHVASLAAFGLVTSWNPTVNGDVHSIAWVGNTAFVGGAFTVISGASRTGIAAIDANGVATVWDPHPTGFPATVYSVLESAGTLYAGGSFNSIAETPHNYFAGMGEVVTAVESEPAPGVTPTALRAAPNPFDQSTRVQFSLPLAGETRVTVYDVAGRRVREIHSGWLPSGRHAMSWDGREDSGRPVAAGVYFLRVKSRTGFLASKIWRVK